LVGDLTVVWSDSANSLTNWTSTGGWNITADKYVSAPTSFTDSPGGSPPPFAVSGLSWNVQLPGSNSPKTFLEFDTQWAMEYGWYYAQVEISTNDGSTWVPLNGQYTYLARYPYWSSWEPYYGGVQSTWVHEIMDISDYGRSPFKFRFTTQCEAVSMDGWYIDNVKISALVNTKGAMITMDVRTVDLGRISKTTSRYDTTLIVRNIGFAADSLVVSVDPGNVVPDTAVSVLPAIFTLAPGDSEEVTFSIDPSLLAPSSYVAQVIVESKHSVGQTKFQKNYEFQVVISSISDLVGIPAVIELGQNYPNPFNPSTTIRYGLPNRSNVTLTVFNTQGQRVATLVQGEQQAGYHEVKFDASGLSSGVYVYQMQAGGYVATKKLLLLR
jgi:hypothetical protein